MTGNVTSWIPGAFFATGMFTRLRSLAINVRSRLCRGNAAGYFFMFMMISTINLSKHGDVTRLDSEIKGGNVTPQAYSERVSEGGYIPSEGIT